MLGKIKEAVRIHGGGRRGGTAGFVFVLHEPSNCTSWRGPMELRRFCWKAANDRRPRQGNPTIEQPDLAGISENGGTPVPSQFKRGYLVAFDANPIST